MSDPAGNGFETDAVRQQREHIAHLEAQLAEQSSATAVAEALALENVLLKAGVDTESALGKMFAKSYDGERTVDAVKAAAAEVGALTAPTAPPPPAGEPTADDLRQTAERAALSSDGQAGDPLGASGNPVEEAYGDFRHELSVGKSRDDASAAVIGRFIGEANAGNPDFKYSPETWRAQQGE